MENIIKNTIKAFELCGFSYGSIIKKDWFMSQFGISAALTVEDAERNTTLYASFMGSLRTALLIEKKMALKTKRGYGQEVVKPMNQTMWAMDEFSSGLRKAYNKTIDRVSNIDFDELTSREISENTDAIAKLSFFAKRTSKHLRW